MAAGSAGPRRSYCGHLRAMSSSVQRSACTLASCTTFVRIALRCAGLVPSRRCRDLEFNQAKNEIGVIALAPVFPIPRRAYKLGNRECRNRFWSEGCFDVLRFANCHQRIGSGVSRLSWCP